MKNNADKLHMHKHKYTTFTRFYQCGSTQLNSNAE